MNVSRVHNKLKEGRYAKSVRVEAVVYTAAVLEVLRALVIRSMLHLDTFAVRGSGGVGDSWQRYGYCISSSGSRVIYSDSCITSVT